MRDEQRVDSVLNRTFSNDPTLHEVDEILPADKPPSKSPSPKIGNDNNSDVGKDTSSKSDEGHGITQFHYQVAKCDCDDRQVSDIWATLSRHDDGSILAKSSDDAGRTPLHLAAQNNDVEVARVLVNFSADVNARDCEPASVLDFAIANNCEEFVQFLLDQSVDESEVAEKNQVRFRELKQMIRARKAHKTKQFGIPARTQSLTSPRRFSMIARFRTGSVA